MKALLVALALLCFAAGEALAYQPDETLADPALEARARDLSRGLRCLVCQNQSIDDSDAPLARDLRIILRERLTAGDTNDQAIAFITARYGDFVLLRPPVTPATWALWFGPAALLLIGAGGLVVALRRRKAAGETAAPDLSAAERARLAALLQDPTLKDEERR
ncbi:MAG: cytochrome c-type biogenesis protein [Alphaproteobacteria bacterium]